jgi:hypothetical protein
MTTEPPNGDLRLQRCGFAKLVGSRGEDPIEYYMLKYEIVLGRHSKNFNVDIVLGATLAYVVLRVRIKRH